MMQKPTTALIIYVAVKHSQGFHTAVYTLAVFNRDINN